MGIKIKFTGFDEMIDRIEKSGKKAKPIVSDMMERAAETQLKELKASMVASGVSQRLVGEAKAAVEWEEDHCTANVGYKMGSYNPDDPSDGFKAVFINYGTPRISPREYLEPAKKKSQTAIKKEMKKALTEILEGVTE